MGGTKANIEDTKPLFTYENQSIIQAWIGNDC